jgi:hypothetical protein
MEQSWQYVQERINLIYQMNDGVKDQSEKNKPLQVNDPYSITPPGVTISGVQAHTVHNQLPIQMIPLDQHQKREIPLAEEVSKMMMNPQFKQPVFYDETGVCTGDSCSIKPRSKSIEKIIWVDGNNQVSFN